jgi:DNA-binding NarL/FixJ family response regulator
MPTTTELIPCPQCGVPRPLKIRAATQRAEAEQRVCTACNTTNIRNWPVEPDEMAIERLVAGIPVRARPVERQAAVAYLTRQRLSAAQIARRIGCTKRTVERHRQRLAS